ncbi:MAG: FecCD family ABC transporter permease [Phycisphaerales bacterium]
MLGRQGITITGLFFACATVVTLRLLIGSDGWGIVDDPAINRLRMDRVIIGGLVGASLGLSGALLQSLLRNPLASPDLMGLSAGAGFAVTLRTWQAGSLLGASAAAFPALIGAMGVLLFIWFLSQRRGIIDPITMILVGVIVSVVLGAATMLVVSLMPDRGFSVSRWMMGTLREQVDTRTLLVCSGVLISVVGWSFASARSFDVMALGEDEAKSVGVSVPAVRAGQFIGAGVLTAISIVLAGPIGFVGLVCPHLVRLLAGPGHRTLVIGSTLAGIALVVGADTFVRAVPTDAGRIPIGVITSLIGGPVFLVMLLRMRR